MRLMDFLEHSYPGEGRAKNYRGELARLCNAFVESGLADSNFISKLTSGKGEFWSGMSEALIFDKIQNKRFGTRSAVGTGPDFLLQDGDRKIWVEVVCPQPKGLPADWLEISTPSCGSVPHNEILLRWTSAIKEKTEKLVGTADGKAKGYLHSGLVSESDVYVIAVNGCQLRHGQFPALHGISQFPYALEAVFPIGPYQLTIDKSTQKCVGRGYQERWSIPKPNGASVPSFAFLDSGYKMVSAIWAVDFNAGHAIGNHEPSALIHNPSAHNPLPQGFLPSDEEYTATKVGDGEYKLQRMLGAQADC